jgi:nucleoid DNA-binding protein
MTPCSKTDDPLAGKSGSACATRKRGLGCEFRGVPNTSDSEVLLNMTKRDVVIRIARQTNLKQRDVMQVVQLTLDTITKELAAGRGIEFRNFGVFEVMVRKPRVGRNPNAPKKTVEIPERVVVKFKPGKIMRHRVVKLDPKRV